MSNEDQHLTPFEQSVTGGTVLRGHRIRLMAAGLLLTAGMLALPASSAVAEQSARLTAPTLVSVLAPDPLLAFRCASVEPPRQDWETEPSLAVNPTKNAIMATAWIQDWGVANVVGFSTNGGKSWKNVVPKTSPCTGGPKEQGEEPAALDPRLSFGPSLGATHPKGIAYLSSLVNSGQQKGEIVNRSLDGGKTWSDPVVLEKATKGYLDGSFVVADPDPARRGFAYALWTKGNVEEDIRNEAVSHTTDGGVSWSSPKEIQSQPGSLLFEGQPLALPGGTQGTLVDIAAETSGAGFTGPTTLVVRRSTDLGEEWSAPTTIAVADSSHAVPISAALAPDRRTIYVSWWETSAPPTYSLMYSKSTDFGVTWSQPQAIGPAVDRLIFQGTGGVIISGPSMAAGEGGTVGVAFYDHRKAPLGEEPPKSTDYWLRSSHDEGKSWEEDHVAGPFDLSASPPYNCQFIGVLVCPPEGFVGDYWGIAPIAGGFATTFALAKPEEGANFMLSSPETNPTDIFFARTRPTITNLSPNSGSTGGGTTVTVTGSGFALGTSATKFKFGSAKATAVNCTSTTTCTVASPEHKARTVDVKAAVLKVSSARNRPADQFTYN
jgi:hypothetical protein